MIDVDFASIDVQPLPVWNGTVTAWRSAKGVEVRTGNSAKSIRRRRVAWSTGEAADLAGVPVRTAHKWVADDVVDPSFLDASLGIERPSFCSTDVLRLRVVYDLREAGMTLRHAQLAANELGCMDANEDEAPHMRFRDFLVIGDRWLIAADADAAETLQRTMHGVFVVTGGDFPDDLEQLEEVIAEGVPLLEYPMARRIKELELRAAAWWKKQGAAVDRRPPWLT